MSDAFGAGPDAFANAARHVRKARGISQRELAARLGIPRSGLARIETGVLRLPVESAASLFRASPLGTGGGKCGQIGPCRMSIPRRRVRQHDVTRAVTAQT